MRTDRDQSGGDRPDSGEPEGSAAPLPHHHPHAHLPHIPHPQLIEADEDRWKWRGRIRRDPRKLFFYRIGVGVAGLLLMVAAALTGPLPGPGGIPLFLLGLAVWSSEFEWANNLMGWFKRQFDRYRGWSRSRRLLFWLGVVVGAWTFGYLGMVIYGIPTWTPETVQDWLGHVPGLT